MIHESLGQQQRPLQRLIRGSLLHRGRGAGCGDRRDSGCRGGCRDRGRGDRRGGLSDALAHFLLQRHDAIARLAQAVVELAEILLQRFGLLGRPIEILVDLVDVVALDPETELDGAQRVEDG